MDVRGGPAVGLAVWGVWVVLALLGTAVALPTVGPAGAVLGVSCLGWLLARAYGLPVEVLRRFHLDDDELIVWGLGQPVHRLPWSTVTTVTQTPQHLILTAPSVECVLPLAQLYRSDAWFAVLRRVVPQVAAELWARLEDSVIELSPDPEPSTRALLWWVYGPVLVGAMVATGLDGLAVALAVAIAERALMLLRTRRQTVTLHPAGVMLGYRRASDFASWSLAEAVPVVGGLRLMVGGRHAGLIPSTAPNFWAAAAVIQLRAKLRDEKPPHVYFRLRYANGGLAVVGEIEAASES
jgi:hypothetical protein